jgi:hypothetical protein
MRRKDQRHPVMNPGQLLPGLSGQNDEDRDLIFNPVESAKPGDGGGPQNLFPGFPRRRD